MRIFYTYLTPIFISFLLILSNNITGQTSKKYVIKSLPIINAEVGTKAMYQPIVTNIINNLKSKNQFSFSTEKEGEVLGTTHFMEIDFGQYQKGLDIISTHVDTIGMQFTAHVDLIGSMLYVFRLYNVATGEIELVKSTIAKGRSNTKDITLSFRKLGITKDELKSKGTFSHYNKGGRIRMTYKTNDIKFKRRILNKFSDALLKEIQAKIPSNIKSMIQNGMDKWNEEACGLLVSRFDVMGLQDDGKKARKVTIEGGAKDDIYPKEYFYVYARDYIEIDGQKFLRENVIGRLMVTDVKEQAAQAELTLGRKKILKAHNEGKTFFVRRDCSYNNKIGESLDRTIAVFKFSNKAGLSRTYADRLHRFTKDAIYNSGKARVVERETRAISKERELQKKDLYLDAKLAAEQGIAIGADYVLVGEIVSFDYQKLLGANAEIDVKLYYKIIKTKTGELVFQNSFTMTIPYHYNKIQQADTFDKQEQQAMNNVLEKFRGYKRFAVFEDMFYNPKVMELTEVKKGKVKALRVASAFDYQFFKKYEVYEIEKHEVDGKTLKRRIRIGNLKLTKKEAENLYAFKVKDGEKAIYERFTEGVELEINAEEKLNLLEKAVDKIINLGN